MGPAGWGRLVRPPAVQSDERRSRSGRPGRECGLTPTHDGERNDAMGPEHSWQGGWWVFPRAMPLVTVIVVVVLHTSTAHD
jgi:hypothetical protein